VTLSKPSLPAAVVVLLILSPLALITPWIFVLVAPFALVAMIFIGVPSLAAREATTEKAAEGVELMCLIGLGEEPKVVEQIQTELNAVWAAAPAAKDPVACACVRKEGDHYLGVLRMRTTDGHSYVQTEGATAAEAGTKLAEALQTYQKKLPKMLPEPPSYLECQADSCHLGRKSIFFIDRDKFGRPQRHETT